MRRDIFLMMSLIFILVGMVSMTEEPRLVNASPFLDVDVDTAYDMMTNGSYPDLVLLDVRTKSEYDEGHIYKAVWIPVAELESRISELEGYEDHKIIVYCKSGVRSVTASGILDSYNFTKVYNLLGGITSWQSSGYPVWIATVHNLNTTINYDTIQAAIDAFQTLDSHRISVESGVYHEYVRIHKSLKLTGEDKNDTVIDGMGEIPTVVLVLADNVSISQFTVKNSSKTIGSSDAGIRLSEVSGCSIFDNNLKCNRLGIFVDRSYDIEVTRNSFIGNGHGISFSGSSEGTVEANNFTGNTFGITLGGSSFQNLITNNSITRSSSGGHGIYLSNSLNNTIRGNDIAENYHGMWLFGAFNNLIVRNDLADNVLLGIEFANTVNNTLYHNNFINNSRHIVSSNGTEIWDNGCEGNYWDDYNGTDSDDNGVGDEYLPWQGVDNYPLMNLYWNPCDINHDLSVDMRDIGSGARAFGTQPGDERWNCHADITGILPLEPDGIVDMRDIGLMARNFGETHP